MLILVNDLMCGGLQSASVVYPHGSRQTMDVRSGLLSSLLKELFTGNQNPVGHIGMSCRRAGDFKSKRFLKGDPTLAF